ncbi:MAG: transposase [Deltaproteobacteria bacterium]|nr:transposase [Deltaproteobacteria bacterium]
MLRENLETFLARARERDRPVPRFVELELRAYLECGLLCHGFIRVRCSECGHDRLVAFSCKGRGFCPSCGGRRMAGTAAHLVDRVLPEAPVRQWVLSLPFALRYRLAYDRELTSAVLGVFVRAVFESLRRRARPHARARVRRVQCGAITFVQRFGGALNLNVHFHSLVIDGVYLASPERGTLRFVPLPPPDDEEVERVATRTARGIARLLERRGLIDADPAETDPLAHQAPLLAEIASASVQGRAATGERAGRRVRRLGDRVEPDVLERSSAPLCAQVAGLSLHAGVCVPARDRARLERLCRYVARPPIATDRLSRLADGNVCYRLRRAWRDGTTHVVLEPLELIERLVALIPAPRANQIRYHGVLAPCAGYRAAVVPAPPMAQPPNRTAGTRPRSSTPGTPYAVQGLNEAPGSPALTAISANAPPTAGGASALSVEAAAPDISHPASAPLGAAPLVGPRRDRGRPSWADLMRRVFAIDVLECPACGGRMRVIAAIEDPRVIRAILECLGLPARAPPTAKARPIKRPGLPFPDDV